MTVAHASAKAQNTSVPVAALRLHDDDLQIQEWAGYGKQDYYWERIHRRGHSRQGTSATGRSSSMVTKATGMRT